ncbi:dnaJ1 [Symbiodinium sp. CCMP2592]|nr:dnaJ1 [Symbiodinium sp. CCMP2592]
MAFCYYEALGVGRSASAAEIKSAYLSRVRKLHPDVVGRGAHAASEYHRVSEAFEVLGDTSRRKEYDQATDLKQRATDRGSRRHADSATSSARSSQGARGRAPDFDAWAQRGQTEALRWYRMPIPEFAWRVHSLWCEISGRQQMSLAAFTELLRRRWRSARPASLLAHSLDAAADSLARLRHRLRDPPRQRPAASSTSGARWWRPRFVATEQSERLRSLLAAGRGQAAQDCCVQLFAYGPARVAPACVASAALCAAAGGAGSFGGGGGLHVGYRWLQLCLACITVPAW